MRASQMTFEREYDDDSGVQYAVRYTASKTEDEDDGTLEIESKSQTVTLPIDMLHWLRDCLNRVYHEDSRL